MNYLQHRKLLRISTFVAVTIGLAFGTSAMAEPTASDDAAPLELAQQEEQQQQDQDPPQQQEDDGLFEDEDEPTADLPGPIEDFVEFVNEHQREGIENVQEYTYDGAQNMADAMRELIPDGQDQLENNVDTWENRLDVLSTEDRPDFANLTSLLLSEGVQHLTSIQEVIAPGQEQYIQQVQQASDNVQPDVAIEQQAEGVQNYFVASAEAIQELYLFQPEEEEPITQATIDLVPASTPIIVAQQDDDNGGLFDLGDDTDVPGEVEDFEEFVQEHREEGIDHVADYTREGNQHFHDAMESLIDDDNQAMEEQLERFQESVTALDDTPRAQYPNALHQTLTEGAQILTTIQQSAYPQYEQQVSEVFHTIDQFDTNRAIEEQVNVIQNVFIQASTATRMMGEAREAEPEPVTQRDDNVVAQHEGHHGEEPGQYGDEPPRDEEMEGDIGAGPPVTGEVQEYIEFVETLQLQELTTEGDQKVVEGFRSLEGALSFFIQEEEEPGMEEEPGELQEIQAEHGMDEHGMEEPEMAVREEYQDEYQQLVNAINRLEGAVDTPEFVEHLEISMEATEELLTSIQEEEFPQLEEDIEGLSEIIELIDSSKNVEEQGAQILSFFAFTGQTLQLMEEQRVEEPQVRAALSLF